MCLFYLLICFEGHMMQRWWRGSASCLGRFVPESQRSAAGKCPTRKGKCCWAGAQEREASASSPQPQRLCYPSGLWLLLQLIEHLISKEIISGWNVRVLRCLGLGGSKWHCSIHGGKGCLDKNSDFRCPRNSWTSVLHISLGFYLPSCEPRRRAFPCAEVGRSSQTPARMMRKTLPPENHLSKHLSPTLGCTSHPSQHLWPLCKLLVQWDPAMGLLWCQPAHPGSCSHPFSLPPAGAGLSLWQSKGKSKTERFLKLWRFLFIIPLVLTKLLNQPFGIKWAKVFAWESTYAHTGVLTFKHMDKCIAYSF